MLIANIDARIEQLEKDLYSTEEDILKIGRLIDGLKKQESILLSQRSDLIWKIQDLKDTLKEDDENDKKAYI